MSMPRHLAIALAAFFAVPASSYALDENSKKYERLGEISDVTLRAIEAAKPEFLKWDANPGAYAVDVVETDHLFQVTFCLESQKQIVTFVEGHKEVGKWPRCPGSVTVELDKTTLKVLDMLHNRD